MQQSLIGHESGVRLDSVYLTSAIFCAIAALYGATGAKPSGLISAGLTVGPVLGMASWLERDARARRAGLAYDWGFFLLAMWPVFVAWYAFASRGRRGVSLIAKLAAAVLLPNVLFGLMR
jgi:hypothetical protein